MAKVKSVEGSKEWLEIPFDEDFHTACAFEGTVGGGKQRLVSYS